MHIYKLSKMGKIGLSQDWTRERHERKPESKTGSRLELTESKDTYWLFHIATRKKKKKKILHMAVSRVDMQEFHPKN